ncbi:hypothetical protein [Streptomyces sp. MNP-20]|uniref:hypothetical protein n=1 Tax=Streptomyces sp. MNP-20 TaxID=2721165 RepID=UPI001551E49D|nr:hypothetical protein [Streptomyces sp. MNP-20]
MPASSRPPYVPADTLTPEREITHRHFRPGDQVVIFKGVDGSELWGDRYKVVTPSWHLPTDEDGWRLYDPHGGERTYLTAHPRYLVHLSRLCPDCLTHQQALAAYLVPRLADTDEVVDCDWYAVNHLNQVVHVADSRGAR